MGLCLLNPVEDTVKSVRGKARDSTISNPHLPSIRYTPRPAKLSRQFPAIRLYQGAAEEWIAGVLCRARASISRSHWSGVVWALRGEACEECGHSRKVGGAIGDARGHLATGGLGSGEALARW